MGLREAPTGYGQQTALACARLKEHYHLGISAFYGLEANILPWNGIPVLPNIGQTHGNQTIVEHAEVFFGGGKRDGGLTLTLTDVWVLDPNVWNTLKLACWVPIDHDPAPPPVAGFLKDSGCVPIAMSRFGQDRLSDLDALYVPHAVDTSVFRPQPQKASREAVQLPKDAFLVGMVAANKGNPSRKCFPEAFRAFKALYDRHPEAVLYLHTEALGRFDGVNLIELADVIGIPREALYFCDQYRIIHFPSTPERMAQVYSAMDVLLMPSAGEGFGIPSIEAQACGVPVIISDFAAQPELLGGGWKVSGQRWFTPLKAWQFSPNVEDLTETLQKAYDASEAERKKTRKAALRMASGYDVEKVMQTHMLPALEEARERLGLTETEPAELEILAA